MFLYGAERHEKQSWKQRLGTFFISWIVSSVAWFFADVMFTGQMIDLEKMGFRAILTGLITVVLLSFSNFLEKKYIYPKFGETNGALLMLFGAISFVALIVFLIKFF